MTDQTIAVKVTDNSAIPQSDLYDFKTYKDTSDINGNVVTVLDKVERVTITQLASTLADLNTKFAAIAALNAKDNTNADN